MSTAMRITAFVVGLAFLFTIATVAGGAIDPDVGEAPEHDGGGDDAMEAHAGEMSTGEALPGLASSSEGYRIAPDAMTAPSVPREPYRFTILGPGGDPVTDYEVEHERRMHLIVVRHDFQGFQHVHPELGPDGTWTAELDTSIPGTYRVFADFTAADAGGEARPMTLATDLSVPGRFEPQALPAPADIAAAGDGYEVRLASADPESGGMTRVEFSVSRNGKTVDRVQPYLGADGHLVVLREGDLAFLHAHPQGEPGGSGPIVFDVDYPSPGAYRMYLQFRHRGEVHTAAFTTVVGEDDSAAREDHNEERSDHGD